MRDPSLFIFSVDRKEIYNAAAEYRVVRCHQFKGPSFGQEAISTFIESHWGNTNLDKSVMNPDINP